MITATPPVKLSRAFLRRLKEQDPKLELHWHPLLNRFLMYSRFIGCGWPDDILVYEWDLDGQRPGMWLLDWLQWADKYANGAKSPKRAPGRDTKAGDQLVARFVVLALLRV